MAIKKDDCGPVVNVIETDVSGNELSQLIESNDEEAMIREMDGAVIQACVYRNNQGEAVLSYAGIKEVARNYKNIHLSVLQAECVMIKDWDDDLGSLVDVPCWVAKCSANNLKDNIRDESVIFQPVLVKRKNKDGKPAGHYVNQFAAQMAISKAKRNAIKSVVPTAYIEKMVQGFLEGATKKTSSHNQPTEQPTKSGKETSQTSSSKNTTYTTHTVQQSFQSQKAPESQQKHTTKPETRKTKVAPEEPKKEQEIKSANPQAQASVPGQEKILPFKEWELYHILTVSTGPEAKYMLMYFEILYLCGCTTVEKLYYFLGRLTGKLVVSYHQVCADDVHDWITVTARKDPDRVKFGKPELEMIRSCVSAILQKQSQNEGGKL